MTAQGTSAGSRKLAWALVVLAFLSKVSLSFSGVMPSQLGFVVFQGGIHPYFNVLLNLGLGAALLVSVYGHKEWPKLNRYHSLYATFAIGTIVILWIQHILQLLLGCDVRQLFPDLPDRMDEGAGFSFDYEHEGKRFAASVQPMGSGSQSRGWLIAITSAA
ncbi:MAG: hypothetical protein ACXVC0_21310 [Bdellovibrionota bacterium]